MISYHGVLRLMINDQQIEISDKLPAKAITGLATIKLNFDLCAEIDNLNIFGIMLKKLPSSLIYDELITMEPTVPTEDERSITLKPNGAVFEADIQDLTGIRTSSILLKF